MKVKSTIMTMIWMLRKINLMAKIDYYLSNSTHGNIRSKSLSFSSKVAAEAALCLEQDLGDLAERAVLDDVHDALEHVTSLFGNLSEPV